MKRFVAVFALAASLSLVGATRAPAQGVDPFGATRSKGEDASKEGFGGCDSFTWDVSHELDVLGQPAKSLNASANGKKPAHLDLDQHYAVKLVPQGMVKFAVKPGNPVHDAAAQAGVLAFHAPKAGKYRISISTSHWIDLLDGPLVVISQDFQGQSGCAKARKIVQYELSGNKDFVLQLSGGSQPNVDVVITPVTSS